MLQEDLLSLKIGLNPMYLLIANKVTISRILTIYIGKSAFYCRILPRASISNIHQKLKHRSELHKLSQIKKKTMSNTNASNYNGLKIEINTLAIKVYSRLALSNKKLTWV